MAKKQNLAIGIQLFEEKYGIDLNELSKKEIKSIIEICEVILQECKYSYKKAKKYFTDGGLVHNRNCPCA